MRASSISIIITIVGLLRAIQGQELQDINELGLLLEGEIVLRDSSSYNKERKIWNQRLSGTKPAGIIVPATYQDVQHAIRFFNKFEIKPTVKSGGHCFTGWNQHDDGWVISTRKLQKMEILHAHDEIVLGAGLRFQSVYAYLHQTGYLFPGGSCPTVGVSGYLLGGGHSSISRSFGTGSDSVTNMKVVTASGELLQVNATSHADLFWALRGAGHNNFGVVVEFQVKLHRGPERDQFHGALEWVGGSKDTFQDVAKAFVAYTETAPSQMTFQLHLFPYFMKIVYFYVGDIDAGRRELRRFRTEFQLPTPTTVHANVGSQLDYVLAAGPVVRWFPVPTRTYVKSAMYTKLSPSYAEDLVDLFTSWGPRTGIGASVVTVLGGAMAQVHEASSAVAHRHAMYSVEYTANWWTSKYDEKWVHRIISAEQQLRPKAVPGGHYINYPDASIENWAIEYYGNHTERLQEIKDKWDPRGRFEYPQGIYTSNRPRSYPREPLRLSNFIEH